MIARKTSFLLLFTEFVIAAVGSAAHASDLIEVFTEPYRSIEVAAAEQGILSTLAVKQGDMVSAGSPVASLNHDVLMASLKIAKMRALMEASILRASAEVRQRQRRYEKMLGLHGNGHASEEELDSAITSLEIAQADLLDAKERQKLAQLQVEEMAAQLRRRTIFSPVNGQVVKLHKEAGEYVASLEPVVATIVQLDKLRVKFYLDTSGARHFRRGDQVPVFFRDTQQYASGTVEFVSPTTDADSSTVRVEVVIDNPEGKYRSGVSVRLDTQRQARKPLPQRFR